MFTAQHSEQLALILARACPPEDCTHGEYEIWLAIRAQLVIFLQQDNPRFSRERFIAATEEPV